MRVSILQLNVVSLSLYLFVRLSVSLFMSLSVGMCFVFNLCLIADYLSSLRFFRDAPEIPYKNYRKHDMDCRIIERMIRMNFN